MSSPVVILTGASRGLGLAVLEILLTRHSARVATLSRSRPAELTELESRYADQLLVVQGDVGKVEDNERVVQQAVGKWGRLDALVLNAGSIQLEKFSDMTLSDVPNYVQANLCSILYIVKPALPHLRKAPNKGRIVMVSSGASTGAYTAWGLYSMVKAGMNSLARSLALEEKEHGLGVWAVRPGLVDTSMQALLRDQGPGVMTAQEMLKFTSAHENGKLLPPDQPGSVIAGLAAADSVPFELSGEYVDWADDKLASLRKSA